MCEGGGMRGCVCVSAPGEIVSMQLRDGDVLPSGR